MEANSSFQTVSVVGLGYIGLPTAAVLASRKISVIGVDINEHVVNTVNQGSVHIIEPDLDIVVRAVVSQGYLRASLKPEPADAFLITVPTPFTGDRVPDTTYVEAATQAIAEVLRPGNLVILESTSPVGTTERLAHLLASARPDLRFPQDDAEDPQINIAHCPERVLPGQIFRELISNDRVIGGMTDSCCDAAIQLYKNFVDAEMLVTDVRTAEMCKLAENSFRDINIAFANELSIICDKLDIDTWDVINLANHHPRVKILNPGVGVGGHCIAVDPWFIINQAPEEAKLIRIAREVNDLKPIYVANKISAAAKQANTANINCLGLTFKPNIDDLRESPAIEVVRLLAEQGFKISVVEPNIRELPASLLTYNCTLVSLDQLQELNHISAILVAHHEFVDLNEETTIDFCGALAR